MPNMQLVCWTTPLNVQPACYTTMLIGQIFCYTTLLNVQPACYTTLLIGQIFCYTTLLNVQPACYKHPLCKHSVTQCCSMYKQCKLSTHSIAQHSMLKQCITQNHSIWKQPVLLSKQCATSYHSKWYHPATQHHSVRKQCNIPLNIKHAVKNHSRAKHSITQLSEWRINEKPKTDKLMGSQTILTQHKVSTF